ncbi:MAG: hypothetical protein FWD94_02640 [Treponema sp.]|nr:hypothetical protein [Treponema sp.]
MEKKTYAVYEPGELDEVRSRLGEIDAQEARRMAKILGGEVGKERSSDRSERVPRRPERPGRPARSPEKAGRKVPETGSRPTKAEKPEHVAAGNPTDNPARRLRPSYAQRIKMDRFAALSEFEIKNMAQFVCSLFPFVNRWADPVNPHFTVKRMSDYYNKLSVLVNSTRALHPRNNQRLGTNMEKASPYLTRILLEIRNWNLREIGESLAELQARPGSVTVEHYAGLVKAFYRPLIVLELLDADTHVRSAYKLLYAMHHLEYWGSSMKKVKSLVRDALAAFSDIRDEIGYRLYPLLMKFISERWFPYDELFRMRRRRLMAFLELADEDRIPIEDPNLDAIVRSLFHKREEGEVKEEADGPEAGRPDEAEAGGDGVTAGRTAGQTGEDIAMTRSLEVLESLFPQAGWDRLHEFPDLFPYFAGIYGLRRGYELIAPNDPILQVAVLMHVLEDLCTALRNVSFGTVVISDSKSLLLGETIGKIANDWRTYIDEGFSKEFLPRLSEYCRILEHSPEARNSPYARRIMDEMQWAKRLHFLPHYKFVSLGPPSFKKNEVIAVYGEVRALRRMLTVVAGNIERWNKADGATAKIPCKGLDKPLAPYKFDVANPVSRRMDSLLPASNRNAMHLIFYTLSAVTVLDHLVNDETSWAYGKTASENLFRGVNGGLIPEFGVEEKINADQIFKETLRGQRARK